MRKPLATAPAWLASFRGSITRMDSTRRGMLSPCFTRLEDLKLVLRKVGDWIVVLVARHDVEDHLAGVNAKDRRDIWHDSRLTFLRCAAGKERKDKQSGKEDLAEPNVLAGHCDTISQRAHACPAADRPFPHDRYGLSLREPGPSSYRRPFANQTRLPQVLLSDSLEPLHPPGRSPPDRPSGAQVPRTCPDTISSQRFRRRT